MNSGENDFNEDDQFDLYVEVEFERASARVYEPNDAIRRGRARLLRAPEDGPEVECATLSWRQVEYGYGIEHGIDGFEITDAEDQDLHDLHAALFVGSDLREEYDDMRMEGPDLLVIDRVHADSAAFIPFASELIEHALRRWSRGCFAAVYMEDRPMNPKLSTTLLSRGFQWRQMTNFGLYLADMSGNRPPLTGEVVRERHYRRRDPSAN